MARPRAKELTERELEIMQVFWKHGEMTAVEAPIGWLPPGSIGPTPRLPHWCAFLSKKVFSASFPGRNGPSAFGPCVPRKKCQAECLPM